VNAQDIAYAPAAALSAMLAAGSISPVEIVDAHLARIERHNDALRSYITVCAESARAAAKVAEREIQRDGSRGPLHGIPIAHKDVTWTAGVPTTAHSRTMIDFVPDEDATHARRLREAGAILLGKANTTEFACGGLEVFGWTPNPWARDRYTGGSSCGSASALAAGLVTVATGSDTGGSIRAPSALCGTVGLKPTYGRVSRFGLVPLGWSMDTVGPMTRSVADCAALLHVMAGRDPLDGSSSTLPVPDYGAGLRDRLDGVLLGVPDEHFYQDLDADVERAVRAALARLEELGARLVAVPLRRAGELLDVGNVLIYCDAFALHAPRLRRDSDGYSPRARRRILLGAFYSAAEYQLASQVRARWIRDVEAALAGVAALVTPTVKFPAFPYALQAAGKQPDTGLNTRPFSVSGHPALSVPCGFTRDGLPVGLQLVARAFDEATLLRVGHAYEQATRWGERRPDLEVEVADERR